MAEKIQNGKKKSEILRVKTVGADFDIEHYVLWLDLVKAMGTDSSNLVRNIIYPVLDSFEKQRDAFSKSIASDVVKESIC